MNGAVPADMLAFSCTVLPLQTENGPFAVTIGIGLILTVAVVSVEHPLISVTCTPTLYGPPAGIPVIVVVEQVLQVILPTLEVHE